MIISYLNRPNVVRFDLQLLICCNHTKIYTCVKHLEPDIVVRITIPQEFSSDYKCSRDNAFLAQRPSARQRLYIAVNCLSGSEGDQRYTLCAY
jgi:hypothetical protein